MDALSLKRIAVSGARWTAISAGSVTAVQFLQTLILARLLAPEDFGLMAIVMMVIGFIQIYADTGVSGAIVHKQDTTINQLSSLFWLNMLAGLVVFVVTFASSSIVVAAYEPRLGRLISYAALVFLISPLGAQFGLLLQKELEFATLAVCEIISAVFAAFVTVIAAIGGLGVFSLVLGRLGGACLTAGIFGFIGWRRWRPRLHFCRDDLKDYLRFGLYQMGQSTIVFLTSYVDQLYIGIVLGPQLLGYYVFAWNLVVQPMMKINYVLTRVAFPIFARVQLETKRLQRGYHTLLWLLVTINSPVLIGCAATAPLFVPLFFGTKWLPAVIIIQILAFFSLIVSIMIPIDSVIFAKGRTDLLLTWRICILFPEVVGIYIGGSVGGLQGVALAELCLYVFFWAAQYLFVVRVLIGRCFTLYVWSVFPSLGIASIMGIIVWLLPNLPAESPAIILASKVAFGAGLYAVLNILLQRSWIYEIKNVLLAR
jgi:lipopolysaccharide exporter